MSEQTPQQEQAPKRRNLGRKIAALALGIGAAIGIPAAMTHDSGEARPAPTAASPTPEAAQSPEAATTLEAAYQNLKAPVLDSAKTLLGEIPAETPAGPDGSSVGINNVPGSPTIFGRLDKATHSLALEANGGEGGSPNGISMTLTISEASPVWQDTSITSTDLIAAVSDVSAVEVTDVVVTSENDQVGVHKSGLTEQTTRYTFNDGFDNVPTFNDPAEITTFANTRLLPALQATTEQLTQ